MANSNGQNLQRRTGKSGPLNDGTTYSASGTNLRDAQHAAKIFRTGVYQRAPKLKFLFHVYFDINERAYNQNISTGDNFGLVVKSVKLPSYQINTVELNQYNRKRIVQTKIKYNPVTINFHDDSNNMITKLWDAYYTYYYKDGSNFGAVFQGARGGINTPTQGGGGSVQSATDANYNYRNIYTNSDNIVGNNNWGYWGESPNPSLVKVPFFKNITIFGFNYHNFTAYTLINPMINSLNHDTYNYSEGGGTMDIQMDLAYETVVYNEGSMDGQTPGNIVQGFGLDGSYDKTLTPVTPKGNNRPVAGKSDYIPPAGGFMTKKRAR